MSEALDLEGIKQRIRRWRDYDMEPSENETEAEGLISDVQPLINEVERLQAENNRINADLIPAQSAIQEIFLNGADQENWPPGTAYYDAIGPYVERLQAENAGQSALLQRIASKLDFLLGFIDASDPKAITLSSEHSVGEQIVMLRKLVKRGD